MIKISFLNILLTLGLSCISIFSSADIFYGQPIWFKIKTEANSKFFISLGGTQGKKVNISWDDGSVNEEIILNNKKTNYSHLYYKSEIHVVRLVGEISEIKIIEIYGKTDFPIVGFSLIEATNLIEFQCSFGKFESFDLSGNTKLQNLKCTFCGLKSIDLSKNVSLMKLDLTFNELTNLDIRNNIELKELVLYVNHLKTLDLYNNSKLIKVFCNNNDLSSLNVAHCTVLEKLSCNNNQLRNLDLSNNIFLQRLDCSENQLAILNLNNNYLLDRLDCSKNLLTNLDLWMNDNIERLACGSNELRVLKLEDLERLKELACNNTYIDSLDLRKNGNLESIFCFDNDSLVYFNIRNGMNRKIKVFQTQNCPNLRTICVDDVEYANNVLKIIESQKPEEELSISEQLENSDRLKWKKDIISVYSTCN